MAFLDGLVDAKIMYRVGDGYRFRHRTLSKWIADDWEKTQVLELDQPEQSSHEGAVSAESSTGA